MSHVIQRGSKGLIRDINNSRVLSLIHTLGPISRSDIAKLADLPPATITQIVNGFVGVGLLQEEGLTSGALGRPAMLLTINGRSGFAVGVKVATAHITVALTDLSGDQIRLLETPLRGNDPDTVIDQIAAGVEAVLAESAIDPDKVLGVGVGMPGLIDYRLGICRSSPLMGWTDVDVKGRLEALLEFPVYADNDVNMLVAAEIAFGAGHEIGDFLTVTFGQGIGCGYVFRREIYRGAFGGSGELGHTKVGTPFTCPGCGAIGCLESVSSEAGIRRSAAQATGRREVTIEEIVALAHEGDETMHVILRDGGRALGTAVGNLVNLLNPERVIVTGEGMRMGPGYVEPMREAIISSAFSLLEGDCRLVIQDWGDAMWARGAASIVVHEMLTPPIYESDAARPLDRILDRPARPTAHRSPFAEVRTRPNAAVQEAKQSA